MRNRTGTWPYRKPSIHQRPYRSFAALYDQLLGRPMLPLFIRNFRFLASRYGILFASAADMACGAGHFASFLSRYGVPVFGTDISPVMIDMARRNYSGQGIRFMVQDMRHLDLPFSVDLLTCNFDALNYLLTIGDLDRTFQAIFHNLNPNGHLIFDVITGAGHPSEITGPTVYQIETPKIFSLWRVRWQPNKRLRTVWIDHFRKSPWGRNPVARECHRQRAWPMALMTSLLGRRGFVVNGAHAADSLAPAGRNIRRVVIVAGKPERA